MQDTMTFKELLDHLHSRHVINQKQMDNIIDGYGTKISEAKDPMYIRILLGISAWATAIFLIIFLGLSHLIDHKSSAIWIGVVFFCGAIFIAKKSKITFLNQLALALAFSGNILILMGLADTFHSFNLSRLVVAQAIICGIVYFLFQNNIYRFFSPIVLSALATAWIIEEKASYCLNILIAAEMILFGVLILRRIKRAEFVPLIYSVATMLTTTLLLMNFMQVRLTKIDFQVHLWPSSVLLSAGLIYIFINLAGGFNRVREPWFVLATCSAILLGIFTTPGILVAIGLLVIGYAYSDRILSGIAYIFLPCFLVLFYYALNVDLAYKSYVLAGSGFLLLVVRWIAGYFRPNEDVI